MLRLLRQISFRQLRASWGRAALVVAGTATGVSLIVAINVINQSVLANFQHTIETVAGPAALEVVLGIGEVGFEQSTADIVRADPEVTAAVPLVRGTIALADDPESTLQLFGVDLVADGDLDRYHMPLLTDRRELTGNVADPRSLLLTRTFAEEQGIGLGETLALSTPTGVAQFTVRGLLEPEGFARAFGGRLAVMDLPAAQIALGKTGRIDQIDVILPPDVETERVRSRLENALPSTLSVRPPEQRGLMYERILASFQAMLSGWSLLCLVAGIYIIYNTTSTGAVHRALAVAGLRVTGAHTRQLFFLLMIEALVLGGIGTALGLSSGIVLGRALLGLVSDSMGVIFQLPFAAQSLRIDGPQLAIIGAYGLAAASFGSYFAARRVSSLDPLQVMRADLRTLTERRPSHRLVGVWAGLVLLSGIALMAEIRFKSVAWGNFGSTLWFAASIVIAIPFVSAAASILSQILGRLFGGEGRVAAESLFRSPTRTGVTVAAIALVLTVAVTFSSLAVSHQMSVRSYFVGGFLESDLAVSALTTDGGWLETAVPADVPTEISRISGVAAAESMRILPGQFYRGLRIAVAAGTDGFFQAERFPEGWFRAGDPIDATAAVRDGRGALISVSLSDRFDLTLGDTIEIDTPTGILPLRVSGVVPDYISDRGSVLLSLRVLQARWLDTNVNRIHVHLAPGVSLADVRARIIDRLGKRYRLKVLSIEESVDYLANKIDRAYTFTHAIQLLIVIVTVAGIFDLLLAAIWERRRELAVWRVVGADERAVRRSVVIESATIGALGSLLGLAVGLVTARIWTAVHYRYLLGYYIEYHVPLGKTLWYLVIVMAMTMLAGWVAARHATRQSILEGIQMQ